MATLEEVLFGTKVVTTATIALRLNKEGRAPSLAFIKAIRQKLTSFRAEGRLKSAYLGPPGSDGIVLRTR